MTDNIFTDFISYIEFLRGCGYQVSISGFGNRFDPYTDMLYDYESHLSPVCFYLKRNPELRERCICNKALLNKAVITEPIYSCCYAGVEELVIPVFCENECLLRINISGYRGRLKRSQKFMERLSKKCDERFARLYAELSENPPTQNDAAKFINPLKRMTLELYKHCALIKKDELSSQTKQIFSKAEQYVQENYSNDVSCAALARVLNYSVSYLEYVFKKEADTTVKAYINKVRLNKARALLLSSDISITELAYSCGFCDSNYFSSAFKKAFGVSPKKFRAMGVNK